MSTLFQPGEHVAGHEILRLLGTGRSAEVYLARIATGELRAFKIMTAPGAAKNQARFAQEGEALARIVHPGVLRVYDANALGDRVWLSLEVFEAETLAQKLQAGRLPVDELLHLIHQACDGLAEAHRMGIIHRDVAPENLLVGPGGTVKVFDFGMAKLEAFGVQTTAEQQIGAARYLAPERARGQPVGPWTDIYALGHILYEGLSGEHAMGREPRTMMATVTWQTREQARPLREVAPWVSLELAALVQQMIEKAPADRPSSVLEVQARLRDERTHLRAPQLRAARNAAPVQRPFEFAPTIPMSTMPDLTALEAAGPERDRAALLPAAWPIPVPATPPAARPVTPRPKESALGPAGTAEVRSTDIPVESAARRSRVTPQRPHAALRGFCAVSVAGAVLSTAWLFFGPEPGAPRPAAPAPAPPPSATAPSASASASTSTATPPATARPRAAPPRAPVKSPGPARPPKP